MMGSIEPGVRQALIRATLHLVNREYELLAEDFVALGLLPRGSDMDSVIPALTGKPRDTPCVPQALCVCCCVEVEWDVHHALVCGGCDGQPPRCCGLFWGVHLARSDTRCGLQLGPLLRLFATVPAAANAGYL